MRYTRFRAVVPLCIVIPGCAKLIGAEFEEAHERDATPVLAQPNDATDATAGSGLPSTDGGLETSDSAERDDRRADGRRDVPVASDASQEHAESSLDEADSQADTRRNVDDPVVHTDASVDVDAPVADSRDPLLDGGEASDHDEDGEVDQAAHLPESGVLDGEMRGHESSTIEPDATDEDRDSESERDAQALPCEKVLDVPRGFSTEPAAASTSQLLNGLPVLLTITVYAAQPSGCLYSSVYDHALGWGRWNLVNGIGAVNSRPAAVTFGRPGSGDFEAVCVRRETSNQYWCTIGEPGVWSRVPATVSFRSAPALAASIDASGEPAVHLFGINQDSVIMHNVLRAGHWQGWSEAFAGDLNVPRGDPSAASLSAGGPGEPNDVHVCVWRNDLHYWCRGVQGVGWERAGVAEYSSSPAVVTTGNPRRTLHVYGTMVDRAGSLWTSERSPDGWSPPEIVPGGANFSAPTAISWNGQHIHVFATGVDSAIWYQYWDGAKWFKAFDAQDIFGDVFTQVTP